MPFLVSHQIDQQAYLLNLFCVALQIQLTTYLLHLKRTLLVLHPGVLVVRLFPIAGDLTESVLVTLPQ